ncbi:hypothetical protein ACFE04_016193 [Oxalis oulophora]
MEFQVIGSSISSSRSTLYRDLRFFVCRNENSSSSIIWSPRPSCVSLGQTSIGGIQLSIKAEQSIEPVRSNRRSCRFESTKTDDQVKLFVGLPLDAVSNCNTINLGRAIAAGLKALKLLGVEGVELPIWWGIVENQNRGIYEWSTYLTLVEMVQKAGLKLHVSLCFNASKEPRISLPEWVSQIGQSQPGLYFTDCSRQPYTKCLSLGVDDLPVLDGKTPIEVYRDFCESFKSTFSQFMDPTITSPTGFFHEHGGSWESPYGDFFLSWYSTNLISHCDRLLSMASSTFRDLPATIYGKLPLIHSWYKTCSHPSEVTAGFYNTAEKDGYQAIAEIFAKNSCEVILPGLDLSDKYQPANSQSSPELLFAQIRKTCQQHGVQVSGQNSSVSGGAPDSYDRIEKNLSGENLVKVFTYQRMGAYFFSPEHFPKFTKFVRSLREPALHSDDQCGNGEELQELAQGSCFNLPSYACIREGPDHAPRFKATVNFNGETFESPAFCNTLRQAEHTAAEVALNVLSKKCPSKALAAKVLDETGVYKNLLQETTHRAGLKLPMYTTIRSGPGHVPVFSCIVELAGMSFTGEPAKTKKQAQQNAALTAWSALKKMSRSGSSSSSTTSSTTSSPLSDAGNNDEQEQVTVARYLATLKPLEGNNSADRGRRFRRNPAPPQRNLISFGDRSPYSLQHQTWLCPQYLSEMPMYQSWPREIPPQQQNHVLALSSFPRPQIFPLVQSVFHPDPLIPDVGQLLYFSNRAMPYPSPNMSQVTIQEIEEASQVEQKWLNGDRNFDGRNFPSASKSLESSSLRDKGDENNKEPIPITGNCTQVESEQIEKHNCNSSGLMDARPNISSRNQNIPHRSQSDIQPQNLGIRPVNGSARYSVVSPVKIRPVNGGLRSNLRTDNGALTNVPPPTKTLSSAYSIRPRPPVLKNNERCKPTASFIAPPVNIRSVIPVCTAPPTEKKLVSQIEKKIIDEPEKNISSTCSDFGKLQL